MSVCLTSVCRIHRA